MKIYYDKQFNVNESSINIGDYVLLQQKPQNKLSTKFNTKSYKVVSKKGSCVIIEKDGITKMRNTCHLKKYLNLHQTLMEEGITLMIITRFRF